MQHSKLLLNPTSDTCCTVVPMATLHRHAWLASVSVIVDCIFEHNSAQFSSYLPGEDSSLYSRRTGFKMTFEEMALEGRCCTY
jgi:hypothetical protein